MKVGLINTFDDRGGAARAAMRLFTELYERHDPAVAMHVLRKETDHPGVVRDESLLSRLLGDRRSTFDLSSLKKAHPDRKLVPFSVNRVPDTVSRSIAAQEYDLINMHWINYGFLRLENLARFRVPIVWTIHDMWPFTGACHYSEGCDRYLHECGSCPLLRSRVADDISRATFRRKANVYASLNLTIVSPSRWLGNLARNSALLGDCRVEVIPNTIDTERFRPHEESTVRENLGVDNDTTLILFGAEFATQDHRKGGDLLFKALRLLTEGVGGNVECIVFGASRPDDFEELSMPTHWLGRIEDDEYLSRVYAAADLSVVPSIEENLPNTVMEALACGTPVAAFDIGGISDMITHEENGWLADKTTPESLAAVLEAGLCSRERLLDMGTAARQSVLDRFSLKRVGDAYVSLFEELTSR